MTTATPAAMPASVFLPSGATFAHYFQPDAKEAAYIARARQRAISEGLTLIRARDRKGRGVAMVASVSDPHKYHAVSAYRVLGQRVYVCDCKAVDPNGDKSYTDYITCKHAEYVRHVFGG